VVPVVGFIPPGLPSFQAYPWDGTINFTTLISSSIPIAIVTHLITMSVGRSLASKYNVPAPSSNQELLALGIGTVVSAFTGGYASCASLSRSAVLASAGAASPMAAGVVSVLVLVVMMQFFTAYLKPLPMAALAAVVMSALMSVFTELSKPKKFYKVKKTDCYVWMCSFFGILLLGVEQGIILGVSVNLAFVMAGITSPNVSILGYIEGTTFYRDQARYPGVAISVPNVLIVRFEGPILFPNKNYLSTVVYSLQKQYSSESNPITSVILDASPVNDIDNAGVASLISIKKTLKAKDVNFLISAVKGGVRDVLIAGSYEIADVFVSTHGTCPFKCFALPCVFL
jgi:SulP family sulfate permease